MGRPVGGTGADPGGSHLVNRSVRSLVARPVLGPVAGLVIRLVNDQGLAW